MKRFLVLAAAFAGIAAAQCGVNGKLVFNPITGLLECTGKTGAAGYSGAFSGATGLSVTAATHGQGTKPVGFCYDNATPAVLIAQTAGFPTVAANGDMVFAWSGSKTGYCVISALGNQVGSTGATGATGSAGSAATVAVGTVTTGAAGSSATVNNSGSSSAATFDFAIPRGATGATGSTGPTGATGATGAAGSNGTNGTNGSNGANGAGNNAYCQDATGSTTTYTCPTPSPTVVSLTGLQIAFVPQTTNSGSSTVNVASLGAKTLKQADCSTNLSASAMTGGTAYSFAYNGTVFCQLSAGAGGGGSGQASAYTTVSFSATPTFTCSSNTGNSFLLTLTGNVTSSTLASCNTGQIVTFRICQDGTGSRTFVPPTNVLNMGTIDSTASGCSNQTFAFDGTNAQALGLLVVTGVSASGITIPGSSSGQNTISPAAAAGSSSTTTLPSGASTTVLSDSGASNNFLTGITSGGVITKAQPSSSNLSDSANIPLLNGTNAYTGTINSTGATRTAPLKTGTSLPGTCTVGDLYFKSDVTAGQNIYECQSTNTWTQQLNSGGGGATTMTGEIRPFGDFVNGFQSTSGTANVVYYFRFTPQTTITVAHLIWAIGSNSGSDHVAIAIMDGSCNKVGGSDVNITSLTTGGSTGWSGPALAATLTGGSPYHFAIVGEAAWTWNNVGVTPQPFNFGAGAGDVPYFTGATGPTGSAVTLAVPSSCGVKTRGSDQNRPAIVLSSF